MPADAGVAVLVVVVVEEPCRKARALDTEPSRSARTGAYFSVLNTAPSRGCRSRRAAGMGPVHAEIVQPLSDRLGGRRGASVGVQVSWSAVDGDRGGDELLGDLRGLPCSDGPADDVAGG